MKKKHRNFRIASNIKIGSKLVIGFLIVAIIAAVVGLIGMNNIRIIVAGEKELYEENTLGIEYISHAHNYYQRMRVYEFKMVLVDDADELEAYIDKINDYSEKSDEYLKLYEDGIISDIDRELFDELKPEWEEFKSLITKAIELVRSGKKNEAKTLILDEIAAVGNKVQTSYEEMQDFNSTEASEMSERNAKVASTANLVMIVVIVIAIVLALVLGLYLSRIISKPIIMIVEAANKLAEGDINIDLNIESKDETGILADAFKKLVESTKKQVLALERVASGDLTVDVEIRSEMDLLGNKLSELVEDLNEIMSNIDTAAEQVSSGSKQVSDSSMVLSQGSTEQASSVEELSVSLEQMSAQIKTNAQNADKANELVVETKAEADNGTTQMREMLKAMEEINDSSVSVNKIIKVIDDIAFQTNILALNAAVEAARAGAAGKGFAVVAEEVKNLAQKSAEAAKETTALIEGSITKIGDGSRIVKETATALDRIVKGIENVADLVHSIAQASKEQTQGAEQISQGIIQVSQVIQTNSSISEETAAASEELSGQADLLSEQVAQFKLRKKQLTGSGKRIDNTADNSEGTMLPNKTNTGYTDISLGKY